MALEVHQMKNQDTRRDSIIENIVICSLFSSGQGKYLEFYSSKRVLSKEVR